MLTDTSLAIYTIDTLLPDLQAILSSMRKSVLAMAGSSDEGQMELFAEPKTSHSLLPQAALSRIPLLRPPLRLQPTTRPFLLALSRSKVPLHHLWPLKQPHNLSQLLLPRPEAVRRMREANLVLLGLTVTGRPPLIPITSVTILVTRLRGIILGAPSLL